MMDQEYEDDIAWEKIDGFWGWFELNQSRIMDILEGYSEQEKEALVQALNNQVLALGMFTWEIGKGSQRIYSLTISPNGSRELLQISKALVAAAPELPDWEFFPAKAAVAWDLKFNVYDDDLNDHHIDANGWQFVLESQSEEGAKIMLKAPNLAKLDEDTRQHAANLVVTSLLGEEIRILHVYGIRLAKELKGNARPIGQLKSAFEALLDGY